MSEVLRSKADFLYDYQVLAKVLKYRKAEGKKIFLLSVSFSLIDFAEKYTMPLRHTVVMETSGMKGRLQEMDT